MPFVKTEMRRERAARMEVSGMFTDVEIAQDIGLTVAGYTQMKRTPEYQELITSLKTGIVNSMDSEIAEDIKALREKIRNNVPVALNAIIDAVSQRRDLKLAKDAAIDLLAIDGRFTKVTRVGLPTEDQGGVGASTQEDAMAAAMLQALQKRVVNQAKEVKAEAAFEDIDSKNAPIN